MVAGGLPRVPAYRLVLLLNRAAGHANGMITDALLFCQLCIDLTYDHFVALVLS